MFLQVQGELVGVPLGPGEDDDLAHLLGAQQLQQDGPLVLGAHRMHDLGDARGGGGRTGHLHPCRRMQDLVGESLDVGGQGGRKQHGLALSGQGGQNLADVADEAHVQHAVGLVEHDDLQLLELHVALLQMVEQAPRRGHQDVDTTPQHGLLGSDVNAADDDATAQRQVSGVVNDVVADLSRQLARRCQDEGADAALWCTGLQPVQDGQGKARRLAGAGLRAAEDVLAGEGGRNGSGLDGGGGRVAHGGHRVDQRCAQAQLGKTHVF